MMVEIFKIGTRVRWQRDGAQGVVTGFRADRVQVKWDDEVVPRWHDANNVIRLGLGMIRKHDGTME